MTMDHSDMNLRRRNEARQLGEQAAEWLLVLEEGGAQERAAFSDWIAQSPLHVEAFLRAATMDSLLAGVDAQKTLTVDKTAHSTQIVELPHGAPASPSAHPRQKGRTKWLAAACVVAALAAGLLLFQTNWPGGWARTHYITAVGEQRVFELDDGSVLHMNTGSKVDVFFSNNERRIELLAGEALFRVHRDPTRPFRVYSADSVTEAIGTQFNVHRTREGSVVSVLEGVVQVSTPNTGDAVVAKPVRLTAGEQVQLRDGALSAPTHADVDRISAWRQRRLIFVDEPLNAIAEEFNRYNRTPKIRIEGAAVGVRRYAAAFDADDPEALMTVLEKDPTLSIQMGDREIVVRSAR